MIEGAALSRFIADNLPLAPARAVPEVLLHRAGPSSGLHRLGLSRSPYWAYQWAGGTALARFILDNPGAVAERRVLDLGCGGGLVAIAAAEAGARDVSAVDIDPAAAVATALNANANGVRIWTLVADLLDGPAPPADLVLAGDLFFDPRLAIRVTRFLDRCRDAGIAALIGDPRRAHLPVARLRAIAEVPVPDFGGGAVGTSSAIFTLE